MRIGIKAGHTLTSGAVGLVKESDETRAITRSVARMLRELGHDVIEVVIDTGNPNNALLEGINQLNTKNCDLVLEIHLNACVQDYFGDGKTTGTECFIYSASSSAKKYAQDIVDSIASLGYRNRGVKVNQSLTFLARTVAPAVLVECFFCDDKDDVQLYNTETMAAAIVKGLTGNEYRKVDPVDNDSSVVEPEPTKTNGKLCRVQVGAYSIPENAIAMKAKLIEAGFDAFIVQG